MNPEIDRWLCFLGDWSSLGEGRGLRMGIRLAGGGKGVEDWVTSSWGREGGVISGVGAVERGSSIPLVGGCR